MTLTGPRDLRDARRLAELEVVITEGMGSFVAVGEALLEIRDSKLYRGAYATFEAYCKGRYSFTDRRARQLMEATEAVKALPTGTTVPLNEAQARELAPVIRDHGPDVAAGVMAEASADGPATADKIRTAAQPFRPRLDPIGYFEPKPEAARLQRPPSPAEEIARRQSVFASAAVRLRELVTVDPDEYVPLLDDRQRHAWEANVIDLRTWADRVESALSAGRALHVVNGGSR